MQGTTMSDSKDEDREKDQRIRALIQDLANLSDEDKKALRLCAHRLISGTRYESPDDLLHEAIYRASIDARHKPSHVPVAVFFYETMRSIASVDRRPTSSMAAYGQRHTSFDDWSHEDQSAAMGRDNLSPESILILKEELVELDRVRLAARERLTSDQHALAIFDGRCEELSPKELRARLGIDEKQFKAADERVRDAIRKAKRRQGS